MNRLKILTISLLSLVLYSCIRDVYLEPFAFPDELNKEVYRVDAFSDSTFFTATDHGVFFKFSANEWFSATYNDIGKTYSESEWQSASIVQNGTSIFCGFGTHYLIINETSTQTGDFKFMQKSTVTVTPENEFLRVGYGLVTFEPGENFERYYIYFEKVQGDSTVQIPTDMMVRSSELGTAQVTYDADGNMIIATNPVFRVTSWSSDNVQFEEIKPESGVLGYKSISCPHVNGDKLYGFDRIPNSTSPISQFFQFDLTSKSVTSAIVSLYCSADENSVGAVKLLDWNEREAVLYHKTISNQASGVTENLGYIQRYDFESNTCSLEPLKTSLTLKYSSFINDIGYAANSPEVLIGTSTQLYHYEVETDSIQPYAQTLLDL